MIGKKKSLSYLYKSLAGDFLDPPHPHSPFVGETSLHKVFSERDHTYEIAKKSQQQFKGNPTLSAVINL